MSYGQSPYAPPPVFDPLAGTPPPRPRRSLGVIFGIVGAAILIPTLCCVGVGVIVGRGLFIAVVERESVQRTVDLFLWNMRNKEVAQAFTTMSMRGQRKTSIAQLQQLVNGPEYAKYDGFQRAVVSTINVSSSYHTDQDQPQGTVATVQGIIFYDGGSTGRFSAVLEKEDGTWRIHHVDATAPPGK